MKKFIPAFVFLVTVILIDLLPAVTFAEEKNDTANVPVETRLKLNYLCEADSVLLTATISINREGLTLALENAEVEFSESDGTNGMLLGSIKTDQEGNAVFKMSQARLTGDKDGMVYYTAKFSGNDKYTGSDASFNAKPGKIKLFFSIEDSLRMLTVTATQKNAKGEDVPVPNETVIIYVPRLYSLLKIGEISLDESGTGAFEFPKHIVGDTLGNLVVLAKIEEHDIFGFLQGQNVINWGVHKQYYKAEVPSRELWTPIAPLWMIITLIIMLVGVWAHYIYAVYELVMIKRLSKKDKTYF